MDMWPQGMSHEKTILVFLFSIVFAAWACNRTSKPNRR